MRTALSFVDGQGVDTGGEDLPIRNPATGAAIASARLASDAVVDQAVASAKRTFATWSGTGLQTRADLMLDLREALKAARGELVDLLVLEVGKTQADAAGEISRSIDILAQAASVGNWYGAQATPGVSRGVDVHEVRYPIGVVAGIGPFNFPILVPIIQAAMALVCGNTVVVKPSERVPSASLRIGELFKSAGLPDGAFNIVIGDRRAVDHLIEHPDVAGISFVGSTAVARDIRVRGTARQKRVQAFGGGKNHLVVMPDADLEAAAAAAVSSAFGAAGQRCMAVSVVVAVGSTGDALVNEIASRLEALSVGMPSAATTDLGPVITPASRDNILAHLTRMGAGDGRLVVDGRDRQPPGEGWFIGPTLVDHVRPGTPLHADELFGPLLSVVRAPDLDTALTVIAGHELGNGASIFTRDGASAKRFVDEAEAGMIGVNVPIPFPVFFHSFGGWKDSAFSETKLFGPGALGFYTRSKTVSVRWPDGPATPAQRPFS